MQTRTLIMAIPWDPVRAKRAVLNAQEIGAEIVWDKTRNAMDTWKRVMQAAGDDPVVFLEDDVYLASQWRSQVEQEISQKPGSLIQFFSMRKADTEVGSRWEPGRTFSMNQCHYLPAGYAASLLEYSEEWLRDNPEHPTGYDLLMAGWLNSRKEKYWVRVPSLVQHEPWKSKINPGRSTKRQSITFERQM